MAITRSIKIQEIILRPVALEPGVAADSDNPENIALDIFAIVTRTDSERPDETGKISKRKRFTDPTKIKRILRDLVGLDPTNQTGIITFANLDPDSE